MAALAVRGSVLAEGTIGPHNGGMNQPDQTASDDRPPIEALLSYLEFEARPAIVLDPDYRILGANRAYRQQYGLTEVDPVGRCCFSVSHRYDRPCDQAGEHCPMIKARLSRSPDRVLHVHHTPRGPEHVDVELRPILDARQEIVAYVERLTPVRSASGRSADEGGMVGHSAAFSRALMAVQRVAPSQLPVLLLGESGTGKELFARAVHRGSDRATGPYVAVDCSGLTETLFESELFGHEKGAFTGAHSRKPGLVETAHGGTLFLDEMGDVPLSMQVKLLRLIETGTYRRVGSTETLRADFRLVAATHKPLEVMVADGRFRQDLYYRLSAFPIHLPPLRDRRDDIPLLVDSLLRRGGNVLQRLAVMPEALERLQAYTWPGNIRELRNVLERARLFADEGVIGVEHLPPQFGCAMLPETAVAPMLSSGAGLSKRHWSDAELRELALAHPGTRRELAQRLGMSERTLYRRLRSIMAEPVVTPETTPTGV